MYPLCACLSNVIYDTEVLEPSIKGNEGRRNRNTSPQSDLLTNLTSNQAEQP